MRKNKFFNLKKFSNKAEIRISGTIGSCWFDEYSANNFLDELNNLGDVEEIILRINSPGGAVYEGVEIYNRLIAHPAKVTVHIDGLAASIASVIAMAGDEIIMPETSMMMIHDPWTIAMGDSNELRKTAEILDKIKVGVLSAYRNKTGLDDLEISELMTAETWLTAEEAVNKKFADAYEVNAELENSARFVASAFKRIPQEAMRFFKASATDTNKNHGEQNMDKEAIKLAKEAEAIAQAKADEQKAALENTRNAAIEEGKKAEKDRVISIKNVFSQFPAMNALKEKCIDDAQCDASKARDQLLEELGKNSFSASSDPVITMGKTGSENFKEDASNAILMRKGLLPQSSANPMRSYSLMEMARMSLENKGVRTGSMDKMSLVGNAFMHTSSDFPSLLGATISRSLLRGYDSAGEQTTFERWTSKGSLPDFRAADVVQMGAVPMLKKVAEDGEYTYATFTDGKETRRLYTYGKILRLSRASIINDDLGVFTTIPQRMGNAARRTLDFQCYDVLNSNPLMGDGVALFNAAHNNLIASGTALDSAKLAELALKLSLSKDLDGVTPLGIRPKFLLVPMTLEVKANQIFKSDFEFIESKDNVRKPNGVQNQYEPIASPWLDQASTTAFYLAADPAVYDTVVVEYLDGNESPTIEEKQGWNIDGVEIKIRHDWSVKAFDWRGLAKNPGA